jgi:two-component system, cell cycle response regulator
MMRLELHPHVGRGAASRDSAAVLLAVLAEHSPGLMKDYRRVSRLARETARSLELPPEEVERIELAARLHDIGKLAIHDAILGKPGRLSEAEWAIVRTHSEIGERIVSAAPALADLAELVRAHHERYDGTGYPDGLAEDAIPFGACVIAVCDAFGAMMRDRPYSEAITVVEALAELQRCAGTQFHPLVVDAFCELFE